MKELLSKAKDEIVGLRRRNEILQAKVDVMDLFALVLHTSPARRTEGYGEDVVWMLQQKINELE